MKSIASSGTSSACVVSRLLFATLAAAATLVVSSCAVPDTKLRQYLVEGERLYVAKCSNCHQRDGGGLRRVYPPVAASDYLDDHFEQVICGMKYGLQGEITVNGVKYNQGMPGDLSLTELELAEIATYIYNTGGRERGIVEVAEIRPILDSCARPIPRR